MKYDDEWSIERRVLRESLQDRRAAYGERILATESRELTAECGSGFINAGVAKPVQFGQAFADEQIVLALSTQFSGCHFMGRAHEHAIKQQGDVSNETQADGTWNVPATVAGIFQMPSAMLAPQIHAPTALQPFHHLWRADSHV
jgi:hypothetical protein